MSDNEASDYDVGSKEHGNSGRFRSVVWDHFTIIDKKNCVAECNTCNNKLSYKTTVTNLKKHAERKHSIGNIKYAERDRISFKTPSLKHKKIISKIDDTRRENRERKPYEVRKARLTDLGGLEGLIINVIGDDMAPGSIISNPENEEVIYSEENQEVIYSEDVNDECESENYQEVSPRKKQGCQSHEAKKMGPAETIDPFEKKRRSRLMDLQLECLEIQKYHMQLEALMLEQQLNVRRSIFTEPLQCPESMSRGTQTDVGGENTRVFFLADSKQGMPRRHLFTMQEFE